MSFSFFPSKALRAYCQGIQLVCHRYSARGGEAGARPLSPRTYEKLGPAGPKSGTLSTWLTWFGYQYTCHTVDRRQRVDFLLHDGSCYKQTPPLSCLFTKRESITQQEQPASKLMKQTNFRLRVPFKDSLSSDIKLQHDNSSSGDLPN